jgi:hypothetical protein
VRIPVARQRCGFTTLIISRPKTKSRRSPSPFVAVRLGFVQEIYLNSVHVLLHKNESWWTASKSELCRLICILGNSTVWCAQVSANIQWYIVTGCVLFLVLWGLLTSKNRASYIKDGRTATLQMLHFIYIFSTNISTEYFKHAAHFPFFSSKCRLFHNANFFGSCIIHILHTGCAKI